MDLELGVWRWQCKETEKVFEALSWAGDFGGSYGEILMYAQNGDTFFWDTILDKVAFEQCQGIVDEVVLLNKSEKTRPNPFLKVCGICCDGASDGSILRVKPYCPYCEDGEIAQLELVTTKQVSIPEVTHHQWNSLTDEEKKNLVLSELRRKPLI
ncbi:MAG: hypothetical protein K8L97_22990 [Anaerolineae bacterium]|nr:hypothetical protein [Anaerolineae bacterium]